VNLEDQPKEAEFRQSVRSWLEGQLPLRKDSPVADLSEAQRLDRARTFQRAKAENRFSALTWPRAFGGYGGTEIEQLIYNQEEAKFASDSLHFFGIGIFLCVGTVMHRGSDEQRERFIAAALRGDEVWCQLFSEPACGSDLAAVRTSAVRDGDDWVLNGQKVWTTGAHYSDFGLILCRTDPSVPKHAGLTMFIVDMKAPGVEVRPIRQISGESDFNEVFLNDVRIGDGYRVGAPGTGWAVAMTTLGLERGAAGTDLEFVDSRLLVEIAKRTRIGATPAIEDGRVRESLAQCWLNNFGARLIAYRGQTALTRGAVPGAEQAVLKPIIANQGQRSAYLAMDMMGIEGVLDRSTLGHEWQDIERGWYWGAAYRIAGGTDEILRNIISERVLGLPADIRVDKDIPFNAASA